MIEFSAAFVACGLGAGARGFLEAAAKLGAHEAHFINRGGIDIDPASCADFELLTGAKATCADLSKMTLVEFRRALGRTAPDCAFSSPPCKGFSGLLSKKASESAKYQALNQLVLQGLFLLCEAWKEPPATIVVENVPRIASRGADLLRQARQLLNGYGYRIHEGFHDCGEIGGLAQHRRRFLLVARLERKVPAFIYQPPKRKVRACGEVLGPLPLPEDPAAGPLHTLPRLSWINWVRLALIPPGGDWRDLPKAGVATAPLTDRPSRHQNQYKVKPWGEPAGTVVGATRPGSGGASVADPRVPLAQTAAGAASFKGRPGILGVDAWDEPAPAVAGTMKPAAGSVPASVADPRVSSDERRNGALGVTPWDGPSATVVGQSWPSNGSASVADPRLSTPLEPGQARRKVFARHGVQAWDQPAGVVAGSGSNGATAVADPRVQLGCEPRRGAMGVASFDEPSASITGSMDVSHSNTPAAVADPRVAVVDEPWRSSMGVVPWQEPANTVRGASNVRTGTSAVADPRVGLTCEPRERSGAYGVRGWDQPSATVTGSMQVDNGPAAVADPRPIPTSYRLLTVEQALAEADRAKTPPAGVVPVILSPTDGTWHRPLTTLELAALQGLPVQLGGKPLALSGRSVAAWRERIGNAVPVGAGRAIAEEILRALLAAKLGTWTLGSTGIWVRRREVAELLAGEVA